MSLIKIAENLCEKGEYIISLELALEVLEKEPDNLRALELKASLCEITWQNSEAIQAYKKLLRFYGSDDKVWTQLYLLNSISTPKWTTDKLLLTFSLKPSWRYYEFEKEFGLSVNDLMDFTDLFCTCDRQIHAYDDATASDLERFANFLNQQEATSQTKTDSFSNWFTIFLEEKGLSDLAIEFENEQGW